MESSFSLCRLHVAGRQNLGFLKVATSDSVALVTTSGHGHLKEMSRFRKMFMFEQTISQIPMHTVGVKNLRGSFYLQVVGVKIPVDLSTYKL